MQYPLDHGEEVGDVDPADPLTSCADASAQAPMDEPREPIQRRGATVDDDARAQDDLAAGVGPASGLLPCPGHPSHLWRPPSGERPAAQVVTLVASLTVAA